MQRPSVFRSRLLGAIAATLVLTLGMTFSDEPIVLVRDVQYGQVDGEPLLLDAYHSPGAEARPVLLLIHGGSWRAGDKSGWAALAPDFVDAGYTVLVPNYRLAPPGGETRFPGAVNDLGRALRWARNNAARFGGDAARVGMVGTSAGGHLALLAAGAQLDRPDVVAAYSAPVNLRSLYRRDVLRKPIRNLLGCRPAVCPDRYFAANPGNRVDTAYPAAFLAYSTDETVPERQGSMISNRLASAGVPHVLRVRDGSAHGMALAGRTKRATLSFLANHL